ncbi:Prepilin signal peptidase of type PulO (Type II secretory pathway) [Nitrosotalea devaniterrae]|uniref:Prepilin signal peptidase of type PulO (Type II secretory pathway) n=1 Tax=Nitrosotalea devaniterrae TaxID=1078905 RepID=A0A128A314_9ARCH|nr:Prepilin signal peptidase of type PulO (Type II secretory pathway) [Candidatus Nitrosotalea devanaterra]
MLDGFFDLNVVRILVSLVMLGLASVIDLKKREINDKLWIGFSGVAVLLLFINPNFWFDLKTMGLSLIVAPVALILWRFGIFGGADALCLIVLAGLAPLSSLTSSPISPFTTLENAAILTVIPLFINLARNVVSVIRGNDIFNGIEESSLKKIVAMFVGYRTKDPRHSFCIEQIIDGKRHLDFSLKHAEKTSFCHESDVWVTPGLPYVLYITGGFIIQIIYGDLILRLIHSPVL